MEKIRKINYFDQQTVCAALVCWWKYTVLYFTLLCSTQQLRNLSPAKISDGRSKQCSTGLSIISIILKFAQKNPHLWVQTTFVGSNHIFVNQVLMCSKLSCAPTFLLQILTEFYSGDYAGDTIPEIFSASCEYYTSYYCLLGD